METDFEEIVTPFMGVWIEIFLNLLYKYCNAVTPFMGVWIEICSVSYDFFGVYCHSLHGSVD